MENHSETNTKSAVKTVSKYLTRVFCEFWFWKRNSNQKIEVKKVVEVKNYENCGWIIPAADSAVSVDMAVKPESE